MKLLFSVFYRHEAEPEVNTPPTGTPAHGLGCPAPCPAPQPALCIGLVTGAGEILTPGGTLLVRKITWPSKKQNRKSTFWLGARSSRSHNVCPSVPLVLSSQLSIFVFMAQVSPRLLSVLSTLWANFVGQNEHKMNIQLPLEWESDPGSLDALWPGGHREGTLSLPAALVNHEPVLNLQLVIFTQKHSLL